MDYIDGKKTILFREASIIQYYQILMKAIRIYYIMYQNILRYRLQVVIFLLLRNC